MRSQLPKCRCKCSWLDPRSNHPPRHNFHRSMRYLIPYPPTGLTKAWFKCPSLGFSISKIWLGFCGTGVTKDCECSLNNLAWKVPCPFQNTFNICKTACYRNQIKIACHHAKNNWQPLQTFIFKLESYIHLVTETKTIPLRVLHSGAGP